jgi:hypothetical protein
MGYPARCDRGVPLVLSTKFPKRVALLGVRQSHVHPDQEREHPYSQDGRPLQKEAEHDRDEADVLGMSYPSVDSGCGKLVPTLRSV